MATRDGGAGNESYMYKSKKPKETLRRLKAKRKQNQDLGPTTMYLQVVGSGSRANPAVLYVFSEHNRYLFNCGEGTQRLMQEHKVKISHVDNIFLTSMSWGNIGGLAGMLLTFKDIGVNNCFICGPPQLESYLDAIKMFTGPLDTIKLPVRPCTGEDYTDKTMTVSQVPIYGEKQKATEDAGLVVAFICKVHTRKGKFLVAQAKDFGLPLGTAEIGPIIAALKNGQTITYKGREVRPEQVCTPSDPGPVFIVVECPSEEFVEAVCSNPQLRRYQTGGSEHPAVLVVHMTPESILKTDRYKEWMERFSSQTEHLILNEQAGSLHNHRSYKTQAQLSMIHPEIFPQLKSYKPKEAPATLPVPVVRADCLLKFQLRPVLEWQREALPTCNIAEFVKEASEVPNFLAEVDKCKQIRSTHAANVSEKYPEAVFLGTGSALPMKIRNVSCTLVNISKTQSLLLDCGEGSFGQLCRHYGDDVDTALSKISTIFISHIHADHHTGLVNVLQQRERALATLGKPLTPVYLIGPKRVFSWLYQYQKSCMTNLKLLNLVESEYLCDYSEAPKAEKKLIEGLLRKNNLKRFQTCRVLHCKNAFACSFTHQSGWKLAFSGDTMPCDAFVHIGKNATLLIHEATLEDGLEDEALEKKHSTTSQAINIGMRMKAKFIMLNHFSQRYAKVPLFSEDFSERVGIAFDHMTVCFADFRVVPQFIPALKALFADFIFEMEDRRERRNLKEGNLEFSDEEETSGVASTSQASKRNQEEVEEEALKTKRLKSS